MASRKRPRDTGGFLVEADANPDEDVSLVVGEYLSCDQEHDGQPVYEKALPHGGTTDDPADRPCYLYYSSGEHENDENVGWWFGQDIGGSMVFCFARTSGFPPPETGWCIPAEEEIPVWSMRVTPLEVLEVSKGPVRNSRSTGAGGGNSGQAWQPPPPPPPQRPSWEKPLPAARSPHRPPWENKRQKPDKPHKPQVVPAWKTAANKPQGESTGAAAVQPAPSATDPGSKPGGPATGRVYRLQLESGTENLPVGIRLSSDAFPPRILEVRAQSLAAQRGVKPGFELQSVNGEDLVDVASVEKAKALLRQRPLELHVRDPGQKQRAQAAVAGVDALAAEGAKGQGRWTQGASQLPEDETYVWDRLMAKVEEEKAAGAGRPTWLRLKAMVASLEPQ